MRPLLGIPDVISVLDIMLFGARLRRSPISATASPLEDIRAFFDRYDMSKSS